MVGKRESWNDESVEESLEREESILSWSREGNGRAVGKLRCLKIAVSRSPLGPALATPDSSSSERPGDAKRTRQSPTRHLSSAPPGRSSGECSERPYRKSPQRRIASRSRSISTGTPGSTSEATGSTPHQ